MAVPIGSPTLGSRFRMRAGATPAQARLGAVVLLACVAPACAGSARPGTAAFASEACAVAPAAAPEDPGRVAGGADGPIVVGLPGPVDPAHAPVPRTPAERFLFAQLYETLVRVDCRGRVEPALAASWRVEDGGRRWTFTLRPDARDWEGVAVTAAAVGWSWIAAQQVLAERPHDGGPPPPAFTALSALDPGTLRVELPGPVPLEFFARPELAVGTGPGEGGWPVGTGPYRPLTGSPRLPSPPSGPLSAITLAGPVAVELRAIAGDGRDALDGGMDLLVTRDPAVIEYARAASAFATAPLAWDRTFLLAAPAAAPPRDAHVGVPPEGGRVPAVLQPSPAALAALARDAVRVEARPAPAPPVFRACDAAEAPAAPAGARPAAGSPAPLRAPARAGRIVYRADDGVARALAERLVALALDPRRPDAAWLAEMVPALSGGGGRASAVGLAAPVFAEALRAGGDALYVLSVEGGAAADACAVLSGAVALAPWLRAATAGAPAAAGPAVIPVVETRSTVVFRLGIGGLSVDGGGLLRLERLRRLAPEPEP